MWKNPKFDELTRLAAVWNTCRLKTWCKLATPDRGEDGFFGASMGLREIVDPLYGNPHHQLCHTQLIYTREPYQLGHFCTDLHPEGMLEIPHPARYCVKAVSGCVIAFPFSICDCLPKDKSEPISKNDVLEGFFFNYSDSFFLVRNWYLVDSVQSYFKLIPSQPNNLTI